jgi:hypothetical protein
MYVLEANRFIIVLCIFGFWIVVMVILMLINPIKRILNIKKNRTGIIRYKRKIEKDRTRT